jgi:hypothetical protein
LADKILNHTAGMISGVAAVYQRHEFMAERKDALAKCVGAARLGNSCELRINEVRSSSCFLNRWSSRDRHAHLIPLCFQRSVAAVGEPVALVRQRLLAF